MLYNLARAVERKSGPRGRDMMRAPSVPKFISLKKKGFDVAQTQAVCEVENFYGGDVFVYNFA